MLVTLGSAMVWLAVAAPVQDKDLPDGAALMDKYVEATGGAEAYGKLTNRVSKGTIEFDGANVSGTIELHEAAPSKLLSIVTLEGVGTIKNGTDGEIVWEINPVTANRILDGTEAAVLKREARFNGDVEWRELYKTAECVGEDEVDGETCYKVVLTPETGEPLTYYYDKDNGLLIRADTKVVNDTGEFEVESHFSDYREVDGVKMPFATTQSLAGLQIKTTIEEVKHNVDLPEETFAIPDEIKELMKAK